VSALGLKHFFEVALTWSTATGGQGNPVTVTARRRRPGGGKVEGRWLNFTDATRVDI